MRRIAWLNLALLLVGALATSVQAQEIKDRAEYDAYVAVINEKDFTKKAALAEKFLTDYPMTTAKKDTYWMLILSYAQIPNWAKAMELAEKQQQLAPGLDATQKKQVLMIGFSAAGALKNNASISEWTEKVLADNPNEINALITKSGLLSSSLPADEKAREAQMNQVIEVNKRALAQPRPAGVSDSTWTSIQVQLDRSSCLMLLNLKKYSEAIAECQEALKLNKKDGDSYYLVGLAMKPDLLDKVKKYTAAVDKLNENRTADQITRDDLTDVKDLAEKVASEKKYEVARMFARAMAVGGGAATQARDEMQKLNLTPDEITKLVGEAKMELGV